MIGNFGKTKKIAINCGIAIVVFGAIIFAILTKKDNNLIGTWDYRFDYGIEGYESYTMFTFDADGSFSCRNDSQLDGHRITSVITGNYNYRKGFLELTGFSNEFSLDAMPLNLYGNKDGYDGKYQVSVLGNELKLQDEEGNVCTFFKK